MKKVIYIFCLIALPLHLILGQSPDFKKVSSIEPVKEQMKIMGENQKTIQSAFSQVKKMEYLDIAIQSNGKFWYSAPSQVRWEYTTPYEYTIIINKGKLSLISGDNQNDFDLENSEMFQQINALMVGTITGNIFNSANYSIEVLESSKQYMFKLKPEADFMDGILAGINMLIEKESGLVTKIKMIETEDNYSEIVFSNIKLNDPISEEIFTP